MSIRILSEQVVAQIAAGEVVERPAAVVKELVENALDAGATVIQVAVTGGGRRMIRISDDGHGIPADEIELAFARHATSKLRTANDLLQIKTLGFRGEALSSIAAVSQLTLITRHIDEAAGTRLQLEGGEIVQRETVGAPAGTIVTVENLFYNTPARLKFLKKVNTEKRYITAIVTRYALAYPAVRFVLVHDGSEVFRSNGSGQLSDVLVSFLGLDQFKKMIEVDRVRDERSDIVVSGYTSSPGLHRGDRTRITLFVNGRSIQDSSLSYAVLQAYHTLLMGGRYPVAVLMIELPHEDVDVNVHPAKSEVRFRDSAAVFVAVQRAVRQAVVSSAQPPEIRSRNYSGLVTARPTRGWGNNHSDVAAIDQLDLDLPLTEPGQYPRQQNADEPFPVDDPTAIPVGPEAPAKPRTLPMLRVVGQVGATYIVAEGPAGMYLIDQHAAHERVLYEELMEQFTRQETIAQHTLESQVIDLPPVEARLVEEHLDRLQSLGFALEPFGPNQFVIRTVPALLAQNDPVEVVSGIVEDLEQGRQPGHDSIEERIVVRVCKQAAVKAGQILSVQEMQSIIRQLERSQSPHTCPHGRPTMLHMSRDQLAREFGRM